MIKVIGLAYRNGKWIEVTGVSWDHLDEGGHVWISWVRSNGFSTACFIPPIDCSGNDEVWNTVKLFPPENQVYQIINEK